MINRAMFQVPLAIWTHPHEAAQAIQPSQALGCSFSPFLADLPGVDLEPIPRFATQLEHPNHATWGASTRRWPAQWQRSGRRAKRASGLGRRKPLSNPHWANTEPLATSGFTSQGFLAVVVAEVFIAGPETSPGQV